MAGYRRFIAYVYDYENGKKGSNCGFIKVEVKDQQCSVEVHLHCPGLPEDVECKVYGFTRKDGLINGVVLDTCETEKEIVECMIVTDAMDMNASGVSVGKMGGMIITTDTGGFFGTEWDDLPIRPENFREIKNTPVVTPTTSTSDISSETSLTVDSTDTGSETNSFSKIMPSSVTATIQEISIPDSEEISEKVSKDTFKATPSNILSDTENTSESTEAETPAGSNISTDSTSSADSIANATSTLSHASPEPAVPQTSDIPGTPAKSIPDASSLQQTRSDSHKARSSGNPQPSEEFTPFSDGELVTAWKIHLNDLQRFPRHYCSLRNNRFVQYGHYNFGHLLLGQRNNGQYILGVPGGYNQQERFMANMFGFPYFKESRYVELPNARGGYWYRLIDAPDSHR